MTAPNFEMNDETETLQQDEGADRIDSSVDTGHIEQQNPAPQPPAIDFAALYRESLAERQRLEEERERLLNERNAPRHAEEPEITDEYFEKHGTAKGVHAVVKKTVAELLRESLGEVGEISQDYKRGKQIASAEEKFFQQFPNLVALKEPLTAEVRKFLANSPNVDTNTYRQTALALIGTLAAQSFNGAPAAPAPSPSTTPSVPSAPAPRSGAPLRKSAPRLTELERNGMRRAGLDPNKTEDVEKFLELISDNYTGTTV